jgi:hypothetical protein
VKKAYYKASQKYHPDKNKAKNATAVQQKIEKAYRVLKDPEQRKNFDYYLDNPRHYFQVTGVYFQNLPKANTALIITFVVLVISILSHYSQLTNHTRVKRALKEIVLRVEGKGNEQTEELFARACERFEILFKKAMAAKGIKKVNIPGRTKMLADPIFAQAVEQVVDEVELKGGARKPELQDLFVLRLLKSPYTFILWAKEWYDIDFCEKEPTSEIAEAIAMRYIGPGTWMRFTEKEREDLLKRKIYRRKVYAQWIDEHEKEKARLRQVDKQRRKAIRDKKKRQAEKAGYEYEDSDSEFATDSSDED